jgi:hypothetical protein
MLKLLPVVPMQTYYGKEKEEAIVKDTYAIIEY